jgi:hypothetical protein
MRKADKVDLLGSDAVMQMDGSGWKSIPADARGRLQQQQGAVEVEQQASRELENIVIMFEQSRSTKQKTQAGRPGRGLKGSC